MRTRFLISEGLASIRRVLGASIIGAALTGISLAIVGGFLLILLGYRSELDEARASAVVEVFLTDNVDNRTADAIALKIAELPEVLSARVRTPEEGAELFGEAMRPDTSVTGGVLPLPTTIRVDLREEARTSAQVEAIREQLTGMEGVDEAAFADDLLKTVEERLILFSQIALLVGILLLLGVIGIVAVTAQLTVVTRRTMIRTMRLLGAERRWILAPFILQGFLIGLAGGTLAAIALFAMGTSVPELWSGVEQRHVIPGLFGTALLGGVLGIIGSSIAGGYSVRIQN
ncbi:MAG: permease-like cell division protein FtsX [Ignavibacteriae bacterium]|nr:permease-like cell division protein FtsX [Ignavibacteriota bacterium]MCB9215334.1 hypothetical protein [Ignavibacteria bacterium]